VATSAIVLPDIFKGIALFTPGGDLIYCIDPNKQTHWHLNLCAALQSALGLPEPPHFLVPSFTATIDRWRDPYSHRIHTRAEVYPPALAIPRSDSPLSGASRGYSGDWC